LNRCCKFKSFVFGKVYFEDKFTEKEKLIIEIEPRENGQKLCSECHKPCPGYDTLPARDFRFIPIWGIAVFFRYCRRRVECPEHGIRVEWLPWAEGKSPLTTHLKIYLAHWAEYLPWKKVAEIFKVTWENVFTAVEYIVEYGLKNRCLDGIQAIGIDEIQYKLGHQYLTLVYQIDDGCRRLLYLAKDRTEESLKGFFDWLGEARTAILEAICTDMWPPYLKVIAEKAPKVINVLDRFHIVKKFNEAIDNIRRREAQKLKAEGKEPILKHSRWLLLKNPINQTASELTKLAELLLHNLQTVRAYLLKESFQDFWTYSSTYWAGQFMKQWTKQAMYSKIDEIKDVARMLRRHEDLILNWFRTKEPLSNGMVEGFNLKANLTIRKGYGFKQYRTLEVALYHQLGDLPYPELTHKFF